MLKSYIKEFTHDGLFTWYSGNSNTNGIGSLMFYLVKETEIFPFFITLNAKKNWNVAQTKGILETEIQQIIEKEQNKPISANIRFT